MRKVISLCSVSLLLAGFAVSYAQRNHSDVSRAADAVERRIQREMAGWTVTPITPASFEGTPPNENLRIQLWERKHNSVKVTLAKYPSDQEASSALRRYAATLKAESTNGLGDEAYIWGVRKGIAFRKDNLVIYVSATTFVPKDPEAGINNREDAGRAERNEETKVTRGFAQHIASALRTL